MNLTRTAAPVVDPITLVDAKAHCRVDHDDEDDVINRFIKAAVDHLDGHRGVLGRCLIDQDWSVQAEVWSARMVLPFPDCKAVVIVYKDSDGQEQTVLPSSYEVISGPGCTEVRVLSSFGYPALYRDTSVPITINFTAGYGPSSDDVPANLIEAMLLLIAHWYEHRQSVVIGAAVNDLPDGADKLISQSRVFRL